MEMGVKSVFETSSVLKVRQTIGDIIAQAVNGKFLYLGRPGSFPDRFTWDF
jgi:hypothetical protein